MALTRSPLALNCECTVIPGCWALNAAISWANGLASVPAPNTTNDFSAFAGADPLFEALLDVFEEPQPDTATTAATTATPRLQGRKSAILSSVPFCNAAERHMILEDERPRRGASARTVGGRDPVFRHRPRDRGARRSWRALPGGRVAQYPRTVSPREH